MIRAVISDLDGTFLCHTPSGVSVPESVVSTYRYLTETLHIPVYLATGRSLHSAASVLMLAQMESVVTMQPGVYNDGRLVFASDCSLEPSTEFAFSSELADATFAWLDEASKRVMPGRWGFSAMTRFGQMSFFPEGSYPHQSRLVDEWQERVFQVQGLSDITKRHNAQVLEFTLMGDADALQEIEEEFKRSFPHVQQACMKGIQGLWLKHISLRGHSKALGVKELCRLLNLRPDEVLVIGDEYNDMEMLRDFPHSIAMGNAPEAVKACARKVGSSCFDDGWSNSIRQYIESAAKIEDLDREASTETITTQA